MPRRPNGARALTSTERGREHRRRLLACRDLVERLAIADIPVWSDDALVVLLATAPKVDSAPKATDPAETSQTG